MLDVKITLIEISHLTVPTVVALYGGWLAFQGQIVIGTGVAVLSLAAYLLMGRILADVLKAEARAKVKAEAMKLKRLTLSASLMERKHQLKSKERKERFGYDLAERVLDD